MILIKKKKNAYLHHLSDMKTPSTAQQLFSILGRQPFLVLSCFQVDYQVYTGFSLLLKLLPAALTC